MTTPSPEQVRLDAVEAEVDDMKDAVTRMDERQKRMHNDFSTLTEALEKNTAAVTEINKYLSIRRGFTAGVIATVSILGGALATLAWKLFDLLQTPPG